MPGHSLLSSSSNLRFLQGGGEMGALIRSINWSVNPLGAPEQWPPALRQSVSMMLTNRFPILICWGRDLIQLYNDAFRPINGETKHPQAMGGSARDTYAEIWDTIGPMFQQVMNGETLGFPDFMVQLDRNGYKEDCYFDFSYSPIYHDDGSIGGILVICMETTEKVRAINKHRESEERFRTMAEGSEVLIAMSDETGNATYFNKAWTDLTGRPLADLLAFNWADLIHPDDKDTWMKIVLSAFEKKVSFRGEYRVLDKNGIYRWILANGTPRLSPDGSFTGYISSCIDITDRKAWEQDLEKGSEELQALNEEIASTNEELVTTNEELFASQQELQNTINELAASEHKTRSIVESAPFPIAVYIGREMRIAMANQAIIEVWGKGPDVIGKLYSEILPELSNQAIFAQLDKVYTTGKAFHARNQRIDLVVDGWLQTYYFNYSFTALTDPDGRVYGVMNTGAEVTDTVRAMQDLEVASNDLLASNNELAKTHIRLKQALQETARSEKLFRSIALNIPRSLIIVIDKNHRYITVEGDIMERMGFDRRDYEGKHPTEVSPPERYEATKHLYDRVLTGETFSVERKSETGEDYMVHFVPLRNEQGEVEAGLIIALEITELKQAEEKSAKLAAIVDSSDDAIISKTLDSVITSWNDSAHRMFGYTAGEMIGETIYKIIPPDRYDEELAILSRLKSGERLEHFETKRLTKSGELLDISVTVSPVKNKAGQIIGLSKIARDITEKKLDETRKNDFIGMASHELKTPLTSLNAILQVAGAKLKNSDDNFLASAMEKANTQVKRMSNMINGFLNISRLESGKIQIDKLPFDLNTLLNEITDEAKLVSAGHDIVLERTSNITVNADRDKIASVLTNLLTNAIKYSPKGKRVTVKCMPGKDDVTISVKDEGIGIKPQDKKNLFERYYRVQNKHTQHIAGFGIGLYLSAEIVHRHGGRIWVDSESGVGSTFYFTLPLN